MTGQLPNPPPSASFPLVQQPSGKATQIFFQWIATLDAAFRLVAGQASSTNVAGSPTLGPLVNSANDAAAKTAGVPVGGLYRNGNAVQIRLT